ncbi:MAG: N-acetylmuramoyl-L-alanine amidase, family 2 [Blastococcus sp.]|nr:N-acetylmuramoyl-L-alanine amidase, family 2 [Blastococcus sp.]
MRRVSVALAAFLTLTGLLVVLPVYATPLPPVEAVPPAIDAVELGSVAAPADEAVVTADGEVVATGADTAVPVGAVVEPQDERRTPLPDGGTSADTVAVTGTEVAGVPALTVSLPSTEEFSALGVTWAHDDRVTDVTVQIRVAASGGSWSEWTMLETEGMTDVGGPDGTLRDGTAPYWSNRATGVEAVVQTLDGRIPRDVRVQLIDPGTSPADANPGRAAVQDAAQAIDGPPIYTRAQWGADESIRTGSPSFASTIKAAVIHHTASANGYTAGEVPEILRAIYAYHVLSRGWSDIGYNVVVDSFGRAWEGRYSGSRGLAAPVIGAHAGGFNTYTLGVSMLGDFSNQKPPAAMVTTVADVVAWKFRMYGVNPVGTADLVSGGGSTNRYAAGTVVRRPTIFGHRDVGLTACPGDAGYTALGAIRTATVARVASYSVPKGSVDSAVGGIGSVSVSGWAVDWDQPDASSTVHVYVDGRATAAWTATVGRPDLAKLYPTIGARPGFRGSLEVAAGRHDVCVYAINVGPGRNQRLGCRSVTVQAARPAPRGAIDSLTAFGDQVLVRGWAVDEDRMTTSLAVHVYVDGRAVRAATADEPDSRVPLTYPLAGTAHGFVEVVTLPAGAHQVCVYAINVGPSAGNPSLGCRAATTGPAASSPRGALTSAVVVGRTATVTGWALDPQAPTSATSVHLSVDGVVRQAASAGQVTTAVAPYAPLGVSSAHGFEASMAISAGTHRVCAYGINVGAGVGNSGLGCAAVTVAAGAWNPVGRLDTVTVDGRDVTVTGWALDHDTATDPIRVHVYVDGVGVRSLAADTARPDIGAALAGVGPDHGFSTRLTLASGSHRVCAYAINVGGGTGNVGLGCQNVSMPAAAYNPVGALDPVVVTSGTLIVQGWAYDPDAPTAPIRVHVYVDGRGVSTAAELPRSDIAALHPAAGARHGYTTTVPVTPGSHSVCAYGINVGAGTQNTTLGCRTVSS